METPNPLIHSRVKGEGGAAEDAFRSPAKGALHSLVSDHVVLGRVIFPGAGYLEMARAAVCAISKSSAAALKRVYFLQPLVLDDVDSLTVTISIDTNADRFELSSMSEDGQKVPHCAGDAEATDSTLSGPAVAAALGSSYAAVDIAAFYGAFRSVGLQYGPEFRALRSLWANRDEGVAVGRLRRRCNDAGTKVHPADLDGALQQTGLLAEATSGETRLPFMVGEATLISAKGRMCSIVERQGAYLSRRVAR